MTVTGGANETHHLDRLHHPRHIHRYSNRHGNKLGDMKAKTKNQRMESWREIEGYGGKYRISDMGGVECVAHATTDSIGRKKIFPRKIKCQYCG